MPWTERERGRRCESGVRGTEREKWRRRSESGVRGTERESVAGGLRLG